MFELITGLLLFLGTHSTAIVRPAWRARAIDRLGVAVWKIGYALLSLLGLWLIIQGYGDARASLDPTILYQPPTWLRHLVLLLMLPVFPLLLAAYLPGRIQQATKHPMLAGVKIWAFAHLLANGSLADVLLFGSFLAWAVADRISLKRRGLGSESVPGASAGQWNDWIVLIAGVLVYLLFLFWAHQWLFGRAPLG
ncbi:NnrU family protein [Thiorhodovibrio frisius]|uniref:Putative membrane protein n=1 Tax=Thiorhodovibrio frisius TaxID=631362 RepID=H8YY38_9GAMM|nr:NnrU family protein [Thiorhodovibrio frisius]EIC23364.1 putative membrane protein [Thiorhodovibrio frisius]WPL23555.1 putative membrane protein [Thiorhodovibrio frisius]